MKMIFDLLLLAITFIFFTGIRRALIMSRISVNLIEKYERDRNIAHLIDEIFAAINHDFFLNRILKKNNATKADIKFLHSKLMIYGDFRKYNRYIPITSFFNIFTLNYLLKHKHDDAMSLAKKMMNHFHL